MQKKFVQQVLCDPGLGQVPLVPTQAAREGPAVAKAMVGKRVRANQKTNAFIAISLAQLGQEKFVERQAGNAICENSFQIPSNNLHTPTQF